MHPRPAKKRRSKAHHSDRRAMGTLRAVAPWAGLLILLASAAAFIGYGGWRPANGPTLVSDDIPSLSRFVESRVGDVLVPTENRSGCRRLLFANDSGLTRDLGQVSCHEPVAQSTGQGSQTPAGVGDRLGALRGAFKK